MTGDIIVCRGNRITMYTLNGDVLVDQPVCESPDDHVLSCVFYEGVQNEWLERELVLTGHTRGVVNIWAKNIRGAGFELEVDFGFCVVDMVGAALELAAMGKDRVVSIEGGVKTEVFTRVEDIAIDSVEAVVLG